MIASSRDVELALLELERGSSDVRACGVILSVEIHRLRSRLRVAIGCLRDVEKLDVSAKIRALES